MFVALLTSLLPALFDSFQALIKTFDRLTNHAAIAFQLGFTRSTQPDTTLLSFKVRPAPDQAGRKMLQLGQFHLQLALEGARPQGKNIQYQASPVNDAPFKCAFQVFFLAGTELVINKHKLRIDLLDQCQQLVELATADQVTRIRRAAPGGKTADYFSTRRKGERMKFLTIFCGYRTPDTDMQQDGAFASLRALKQL